MKYQDDVPIKELQEVLELSERRKMRLSRAKARIAEVYINKPEMRMRTLLKDRPPPQEVPKELKKSGNG
jgi:hypothetical protein